MNFLPYQEQKELGEKPLPVMKKEGEMGMGR